MFSFAMAFIQFIGIVVAVTLIPVFIGLIMGAMNEQQEMALVTVSASTKKENKDV
jgi:hypothetical protein